MTDIVQKVCQFTEDLLDYSHNLILRGRDNFERIDFSENYIVVDELVSVEQSTTQKFIGGESRYLKTLNMTASVTLDFYGSNALSNAQKWATIKNMQAGIELQQGLGINLKNVSSIRNLKALTGSQYNNRYQVECIAWYNIENEIEINPIEDLQFNIINEE